MLTEMLEIVLIPKRLASPKSGP